MPLRNGLYKVHFKTQLGEGSGVVVMQDGKMRGGDSSMFYVGTYSQDGDKFSAKVATDNHTKTPGLQPVFGQDRVNITISGTIQGDSAQMTGSAAEAPNVSFKAGLSRIGD